ncbi:reverse transcriptase domain-containing protein [uncultured Erythrobacter sp.]|uniref:reverse transcriptase domain-containing protein n=1 Tax=uncultured Erythrobacter sp. TaxID=263913 RepID=UPI00263586CE|nr:reverse transcriptase domain-containing protein [uncultured Erythrobacter sp.]
MKSNLAKKTRSFDVLERAWRTIQRNGKHSKSDEIRHDIEQFSDDASRQLRSIQYRLARKQFEFGQAKGVPLPKLDALGNETGKYRPLVVAPLEARIVQRAILDVVSQQPSLQRYIRTPYSFGGLKKSELKEADSKAPLSAVPAAIECVLKEIQAGATWVAAADISSFFTRVSKSSVIEIIERELPQQGEFIELLKAAVSVELRNLEQLRSLKDEFPIEDIGVAQGNSLSPLLGNIALAEFDIAMNSSDCRCIRYIDDFIILAPTKKATNAKLKQAKQLLGALEMDLSPEKSAKDAMPIEDGFEFLGIEISPGLIKPAGKARQKFVRKVIDELGKSSKALFGLKQGNAVPKANSVTQTLKRVDGIIDGWGKHYWFCNDAQTFRDLDTKIHKEVAAYLGAYGAIRSELPEGQRHLPLGFTDLSERPKTSFEYPSQNSKNG